MNAQSQGSKNILDNTDYLKNVANVLKNDPFQEAYVGQFLHVIGQNYFKLLDNYERAIAGANNTLIFSYISEALVSIDLTAAQDESGLFKMAVGAKGIDAPKNIYGIFPFDDNLPNTVPIMASLGVAASSLEHTVFEATSGWRTESTISILRHAVGQDIPIYALTNDNFFSNKSKLALPTHVIASM